MLRKSKVSVVSIIAIAVIATIGLLALLLGGCAGTKETGAAEEETIKIGLVTWSEGPTLVAGRAYTRAFKSAINQINESGGILDGKMVEGIIAPQGSTGETAKSAALRLVMKDQVVLLNGPHWAGAAPAGLEVAQKYKLPYTLLQGGTWLYEQNYPGTACFAGNAYGRANAQTRWAEKKGFKNVVMLCMDIPYNHDVVDTAQANWSTADSPKILDVIWYDYTLTDIKAEVTKAVSYNPDLIWCEEWSDVVTTFVIKTLDELGYTGDVVFTPEIKKDAIGGLPVDVSEGVYIFEEWVPDSSVPENKAFCDLMLADWGELPEYDEEVIYSGTYFILKAMDAAGVVADGSDEALDKISKAMHSLEWTGPYGVPTNLDPSGLAKWDKFAMAKIQNGVMVLDEYIKMQESDWLPWLK